MIKVDWESPVLLPDEVSVAALDDFYAAASEIDRLNMFFILENSVNRYAALGDEKAEAYFCFLTAYYVFIPLTPPASGEIALAYIKRAVALNPIKEYIETLEEIKAGVGAV